MIYKVNVKKWYIAIRNGKYFNGELDVNNSLSATFDNITWFDNEENYNKELEKLGIEPTNEI